MNPVSSQASPVSPQANDVEKAFSPRDNTGIKIKTIVARAFVLLSSAAAFGVVAGLSLAATGVAISAMTTLACVSAVGLAALMIAKGWPKMVAVLPEPLQRVAHSIQSVATSIFSILALAVIFPLDLERFDPKEFDPNQIPVLFIHGFCGSSNNWLYHRQRLREEGYPNLFTINLGNPLQSIEHYADLVKQKISKIQQLTGQNEIVLIGHSMGGLVSRAYRYGDTQGITVREIITIGTPLDGTYTAYLASRISKSAAQMRPKSAFVRGQQESSDKDDDTKYFHIGTKVDSIVIPNSSAIAGKGKTAMLEATGHIAYLFSDRTADLLIEELNALPIRKQRAVV
jgi:hypothetical protein